MALEEHEIVEVEEQGTTVYRCTKCGRVQKTEGGIELYRCVPIDEQLDDIDEEPLEDIVEE